MISNSKYRATVLLVCMIISGFAQAITPLPNGGFESGSLQGWTASGKDGGFASVVGQGDCFSSNDTTGIIFSENYAALLRSNQGSSVGSTGVLTSAPFTAGIGVAFKALTETFSGGDFPDMPVNFTVRIVSTDGAPLSATGLVTSVVELEHGCPGLPANGAFSTHFVGTRPFAGQQIRLEFMQSSRIRRAGLVTLIDDVVRFDTGDSQILPNRPTASTGISQSSSGRLRLDGSLSSDPADLTLEYSWTVRGEAFQREGEFPCIDDLEPGSHQATLVVDNGSYTDADTLYFVVSEPVEPEEDPGDDDAEFDEEETSNTRDGEFTLDCSDYPSVEETPSEPEESDEESVDDESIDEESVEVSRLRWRAPALESADNLPDLADKESWRSSVA